MRSVIVSMMSIPKSMYPVIGSVVVQSVEPCTSSVFCNGASFATAVVYVSRRYGDACGGAVVFGVVVGTAG